MILNNPSRTKQNLRSFGRLRLDSFYILSLQYLNLHCWELLIIVKKMSKFIPIHLIRPLVRKIDSSSWRRSSKLNKWKWPFWVQVDRKNTMYFDWSYFHYRLFCFIYDIEIFNSNLTCHAQFYFVLQRKSWRKKRLILWDWIV